MEPEEERSINVSKHLADLVMCPKQAVGIALEKSDNKDEQCAQPEDPNTLRQEYLFLAKVSEVADKYDEMAAWMKKIAELNVECS